MVRAAPERYVAQGVEGEARGKIFLDYLRNGRGATAVCPYSTRARAGAPVSTAARMGRARPEARPARVHVATVPKRLARAARDPWEGYTKLRQSLPALR